MTFVKPDQPRHIDQLINYFGEPPCRTSAEDSATAGAQEALMAPRHKSGLTATAKRVARGPANPDVPRNHSAGEGEGPLRERRRPKPDPEHRDDRELMDAAAIINL